MSNIICIDLTFNLNILKKIYTINSINRDLDSDVKKYSKLWISNNILIAYIKRWETKITFSMDFELFLTDIPNSNPTLSALDDTKISKESIKIEIKDIKKETRREVNEISDLTLDAILDKISETGLDSLTKRERDFLDNNN